MNKKAFTAIEAMISMAFGAFIILAVIGIPNMLFSQVKSYRVMESQQFSIQTIVFSVRKDLQQAEGRVHFDGEYLMLNDIIYSFEDDGVYRIQSENTLKISRIPLKLEYYDDAFTISTIDIDEAKSIRLTFNKIRSSFDVGGL